MGDTAFLQSTINDVFDKANAEWKDVYLISPHKREQSLLYEYAEYVAIRSLLKIVELPIYEQQRPNALEMSPTGRVPFLRIQDTIIASFPRIVEFIELKGIKMSNTRTPAESTDMQALISMIDDDLRHVEMFIVWFDEETYEKVTKPRTASVYNFPVSWLLPAVRRRSVTSYLRNRSFVNQTVDDMIDIADRVFETISTKLGTKRYIVGDQPSELDCLVFGHLYTILTTELPNLQLVNTLKNYQNLIDYCTRLEGEFFGHESS